jgi:putative Mg2+ transporter-C (MgtC) family protein
MVLNNNIQLDFLGEFNFVIGILIQVCCAILVGFLIGFNRELSNKAAGIKTNIMICLGATVYTSLSLLNINPDIAGQDPNRLAAQIVSGIGFLGAGAIMRGDGYISGLTTAATIWVVAALGVAIGFGYPSIAIGISIIVLLILVGTNKIYSIFMITKNYKIKILSDSSVTGIIKGVILNSSVELIKISEGRAEGFNDDGRSYHKVKLIVEGNNKTIHSFVRLVRKVRSVKNVDHSIID